MSEVPSNQEREGTYKTEQHNLTSLFSYTDFPDLFEPYVFYIDASPWVTIYETFSLPFAGETE